MTGGRRVIRTKGRRVEVPEEGKAEIVRLSRRGHSLAKISDLTGYSRWTVDRVLREARGEVAVKRERRSTVTPSVEAASPQLARLSEPARLPSDGVVDTDTPIDEIVALPELVNRIMAAHSQAAAVTARMETITSELAELWERAERVSQMEQSLNEALTVFRQMRDQLTAYRTRLDEAEQNNLERASVVHSELGSFTG